MDEPQAFVLGGNTHSLAFVSSFRPEGSSIVARLVPLAWTPIGVACGAVWQNVGIAKDGLIDWVDRTFVPEDERSFLAPMRVIELLARVQWHSELPTTLTEQSVLNIEDLPDEVSDGLAQPAATIVQCAACRRLCVRDHFVWKEKQLCAWDFHASVFGKRGPWRNGAYEPHHFETLPTCAYVAGPILADMHVEVVMVTNAIGESVTIGIIEAILAADPTRPYMAVRTEGGFTVLRETV